MSETSNQISSRDERYLEIREWASPYVWTERMLTTLHRGVKRGKWYSLKDKLISRANLDSAWESVKENKGAPGTDKVSIYRYEEELEHNQAALLEDLKSRSYRPHPVRRTEIPKGNGKDTRPLGIPTVRDRIVQTALKQVIEPIYDIDFSPASFGFRPGRGCKDALRRVNELLKQGYLHIVDADIQSYFDTIDHERLMKEMEYKISDSNILSLIRLFLKADIFNGLKYWTPEEGTPQGGVISPLLANIYLSPLDHLLVSKGFEIIRYADDFLILCKSKEDAIKALEIVREWTGQNKLCLHPEKTHTVDMTEAGKFFEFLGYHFQRGTTGKKRISRWPRKRSEQKMKNTVRKKTRRCNWQSMEDIIASLKPSMRGWFQYFKHSNIYTFRAIDQFTRRRLRSILRKRKKRKGAVRLSDNFKWTNEFFANLGFLSLEEAWKLECQSLRSKH